jgi:hypothetical protein
MGELARASDNTFGFLSSTPSELTASGRAYSLLFFSPTRPTSCLVCWFDTDSSLLEASFRQEEIFPPPCSHLRAPDF